MKWFKHRKHKWIPCYVWGLIGDKEIKVITTYCEVCHRGHKEIMDLIHTLDKTYCATYNEQYFYITKEDDGSEKNQN